MKKTNLIILGIISIVAIAGAITIFSGEYVTAVEATVDEIVTDSVAYDSQLVITEGEVTDWEIKEYTITITGPGVDETLVITRFYLIIEDTTTSETIKVRLNYGSLSPDLTAESFTVGELVNVEGVVKEFRYESLEVDVDIDLVILAKEIVKENGDVITILSDETIEEFRARRQARRERRQSRNPADYIEEITAEVIHWEINEYNITITGPDDFYKTKIVTIARLLVENTETGSTILVLVSHPRLNTTVAEEFISVGEIITIKGVIRDGELNRDLFFSDLEYDQVMLAISVTNSSEETVVLITRDAFLNARPRRMFRFWNRFRSRPRIPGSTQ